MEVSKVHMQLSKESQKLEFQENNQERVRSEIEHLSEEVQENQKDTGSINENVKALKQQIEHLKESCEAMERKIIEDQNRHQKMQEEVKEKEVLYKDILKEREEMLERISGYDKEMYRLESQRENRKGKKKSFWIICGRITRSHIIRQNRGSIWMRRRALQRLRKQSLS